MLRLLGTGIVLTGFLLLAPENVQGQKKPTAMVVPANPAEYKALAARREVNGIIASAIGKLLVFRIDNPQLQPPKGGKGKPMLVNAYKEFELDLDDKVVVKRMFVSLEFDNKGFLKKDEAQSKELRTKGFIAVGVEGIKSGNVAKLVITSAKQADAGAGNVAKPLVKTIYLMQEGVPTTETKAPEKKKKN